MHRVRPGSWFALVLVAPTWLESSPVHRPPFEQKLIPDAGSHSPQPGEMFGSAVAVAGDWLFVGAPREDVDAASHQGAVYVYRWVSTSWQFTQRLVASSGQAGDNFGCDLAVEDDVLVVGAQMYDRPLGDPGTAYVFGWSGATWSELVELPNPALASESDDDLFGSTVAIDGDWIVVGAPGPDNGSGAAWVFERQAGAWSPASVTALVPTGLGPPLVAHDRFGAEVAIDGDRIAIAADASHASHADGLGRVYVWKRAALTGTWEPEACLQPPVAQRQAYDGFGFGLAIDGATIVVGATAHDGPYVDQGAAFVFTLAGEPPSWTQAQRIFASQAHIGAEFGWDIVLSGDRMWIGATEIHLAPETGEVYGFMRAAGVWSEARIVRAVDGASSDTFGKAIAVSGTSLVIGARGVDLPGPVIDCGAVYTIRAPLVSAERKP